MLGTIKNIFSKDEQIPLNEWKGRFYQKILTHESHGWIREDYYFSRAFRIIVDSFTQRTYNLMVGRENILFCPCEGVLGASFSGGYHVVLLYPDLLRMLRSGAFMTGISIVAHEMGHIAFNHSGRKIGRLKAQCEADFFSFLLGFGEELQGFLMDHKSHPEIQERISHLASLKAL